MKRIISLQDISCIGKCSMTVALPVLSAMGIETALLPTAVLSAHTMFQNPVFIDLTDRIIPIAEHWKQEGLSFDAVYSGYLGSIRQIDLVRQVVNAFTTEKKRPLFLADPAMADHGRLYTGFDMEFVKEMTKLCRSADIIVPNITEACLMTGIPFREKQDRSFLEELLIALSETSSATVILTGVSLTPERLGIMGRDRRTGAFFSCDSPRRSRSYHGTGDLFASVLMGGLMKELPMIEALQKACDYVSHTIEVTINNPCSRAYGVDFEATLGDLTGSSPPDCPCGSPSSCVCAHPVHDDRSGEAAL